MKRDQIIDKMASNITGLHATIKRLRALENDSTPAIELALLESKLITFYDDVQVLKSLTNNQVEPESSEVENSEIEINESENQHEPKNNVDDIKAQFESLKQQFTETKKPSRVNIRFEPVAEEQSEEQIDAELENLMEVASEEFKSVSQESIKNDPLIDPKSAKDAEEIKVKEEKVKQKEETKPETTPEPKVEHKKEEVSSSTINQVQQNIEKPASLNDRLREAQTKTSLYDKLNSNKNKGGISQQMAGKPIKDLKKAINLNLQIRFQKELFDGDKRAFKRTIDFVNKCNTFSEARSYLQHEIAPQFNNWNEENIHYNELLGLVKRRFM